MKTSSSLLLNCLKGLDAKIFRSITCINIIPVRRYAPQHNLGMLFIMLYVVSRTLEDLGLLLLRYHGIRQFPKVSYFDCNRVSRLHKHLWSTSVANACWRPGHNDIPRF